MYVIIEGLLLTPMKDLCSYTYILQYRYEAISLKIEYKTYPKIF